MLVTTCRDKKLRIWDVRQEKPAAEVAGHSGAKNSRAVWMGEHDRVATTGFSKMSDRQLGLWDIRTPRSPLMGSKCLTRFLEYACLSGTTVPVSLPCWERVKSTTLTLMSALTHPSDGNIRYYEYENDKFEYLSQYTSPDPQRGIAFLPKRGISVGILYLNHHK